MSTRGPHPGVKPIRVIRWADPPHTNYRQVSPPQSHFSTRFSQLAKDLQANPGAYALIYSGTKNNAGSIASAVNRATVKCFEPRGSFSATMRTYGGRTEVYARYEGEGA